MPRWAASSVLRGLTRTKRQSEGEFAPLLSKASLFSCPWARALWVLELSDPVWDFTTTLPGSQASGFGLDLHRRPPWASGLQMVDGGTSRLQDHASQSLVINPSLDLHTCCSFCSPGQPDWYRGEPRFPELYANSPRPRCGCSSFLLPTQASPLSQPHCQANVWDLCSLSLTPLPIASSPRPPQVCPQSPAFRSSWGSR